ncbi:T9SS type A sorting domain-containing protein [Kriegella sp. EG-1]|nr:T9SS type A sorting domain-containing protein [Flavobacteriaceae bacterium EG-1]
MKQHYVIIFLLISTSVNAQSLEKSITANAGISFTESNSALAFTIGEPIIGAISEKESIQQGFWAGGLFVENITTEDDLAGISVYPNPVANVLTVYTNHKKVYGVTLFSVSGQRVLIQNITSEQLEHHLDVNHLAKGVYVLHLYVEGYNNGKLFKILKE